MALMTAPDLLDRQFLTDPYPTYRALRTEAPIFYHPEHNLWLVSRYADITTLLRDKRLGRSILHVMTREELGIPEDPPHLRLFKGTHRHRLMDLEPPDHTRIRGLVQKVFTPRYLESLRPRIEQICTKLLDAAAEKGQFDLLEDFAVPLPVTVIAEMLGIPEADRRHLRPWSAAIVALYELKPTYEEELQAEQAVREFSDYLRDLANVRRQAPQGDLLSELTQVEMAGDRLTADELIATSILLLNAGHEATVNTIGNGMLALFRHPEQLAWLQQNLDQVRTATEELLRYDTPLQMFTRWAMADVDYQGHHFPKGTRFGLFYGSGNRDEQRFPDPDRFDLQRNDSGHLTFGMGTHFCLGAPLARMELHIAFRGLLERFPRLQMVKADVEFRRTLVIRGLKELWVQA